ncbi:MAG: biliverdin-producing heme oxygenase [Rhodospirillales bacterium]
MSVLEAIRRATGALHDQLEGELDIVRRLACIGERRSILCRFHAMHATAEAALQPHLRLVPDLEFARRLKVPALRNDLRALGVRTEVQAAEPSLELRASLPTLRSVQQALGVAYVLEGSTLGGRIIRKRVAAAGGSLLGMSFFDGYGPATGEQWRRFCVVLERDCASHVADAVTGAVAGFWFARAALLEKGKQGEMGLSVGR